MGQGTRISRAVAPRIEESDEGLRQRKARQTAVAIRDAARSLALERSVDGISVQEIADRAGVSARTVFNYFPSKEDAVLGIRGIPLPEHAKERFAASTGPLLADAAELALESVREGMGDVSEHTALRELIENNPQLGQRWAKSLMQFESEMTDAALLRTDDRTEAMIAAIIGTRLCGLVIEKWVHDGDTAGGDDTLHEALAALRRVVLEPGS